MYRKRKRRKERQSFLRYTQTQQERQLQNFLHYTQTQQEVSDNLSDSVMNLQVV